MDGAEDANHSCVRDAGETDTLDPDSDDDELNDGVEVANGTNPLVADSDGDGMIDGEDVDWLQPALNALPAEAFRAQGTRISTLGVLDAVENLVARGQIDQALRELDVLRARLDGCGSAADANDWVVACAAQARIRSFIALLAANLVS